MIYLKNKQYLIRALKHISPKESKVVKNNLLLKHPFVLKTNDFDDLLVSTNPSTNKTLNYPFLNKNEQYLEHIKYIPFDIDDKYDQFIDTIKYILRKLNIHEGYSLVKSASNKIHLYLHINLKPTLINLIRAKVFSYYIFNIIKNEGLNIDVTAKGDLNKLFWKEFSYCSKKKGQSSLEEYQIGTINLKDFIKNNKDLYKQYINALITYRKTKTLFHKSKKSNKTKKTISISHDPNMFHYCLRNRNIVSETIKELYNERLEKIRNILNTQKINSYQLIKFKQELKDPIVFNITNILNDNNKNSYYYKLLTNIIDIDELRDLFYICTAPLYLKRSFQSMTRYNKTINGISKKEKRWNTVIKPSVDTINYIFNDYYELAGSYISNYYDYYDKNMDNELYHAIKTAKSRTEDYINNFRKNDKTLQQILKQKNKFMFKLSKLMYHIINGDIKYKKYYNNYTINKQDIKKYINANSYFYSKLAQIDLLSCKNNKKTITLKYIMSPHLIWYLEYKYRSFIFNGVRITINDKLKSMERLFINKPGVPSNILTISNFYSKLNQLIYKERIIPIDNRARINNPIVKKVREILFNTFYMFKVKDGGKKLTFFSLMFNLKNRILKSWEYYAYKYKHINIYREYSKTFSEYKTPKKHRQQIYEFIKSHYKRLTETFKEAYRKLLKAYRSQLIFRALEKRLTLPSIFIHSQIWESLVLHNLMKPLKLL